MGYYININISINFIFIKLMFQYKIDNFNNKSFTSMLLTVKKDVNTNMKPKPNKLMFNSLLSILEFDYCDLKVKVYNFTSRCVKRI